MAIFTVTTQEDETTNPDTTSLREAVVQANKTAGADTITFAAGPGEAFETGGLIRLTKGSITLNDTVTIDGASAAGAVVISGDAGGNDVTLPGTAITDVPASGRPLLADNVRLFKVAYDDVFELTLANLTLTGGRAGFGGVLFFPYASVTATDSIFAGNSAETGSAYGGALASEFGSITVERSTFSGNEVAGGSGNGGAIGSFGGTIRISDSSFVDNTAEGSGGAVGSHEGLIHIKNSSFSGNAAESSGGAISNHQGQIIVESSSFTGNTAEGSGGAISNHQGQIIVESSSFSGNAAEGYGGAIDSHHAPIRIEDSTFSGNTAQYSAGAISSNEGAILASGSTFTGNTSPPSGNNDILTAARGTVTLTDSIVTGNASDANDTGASGRWVLSGSNIVGGVHSIDGVAQQSGLTAQQIFAETETRVFNGSTFEAGRLADNGGPVQTVALLASRDNPALDAAMAGDRTPLTDARGSARLVDLPNVGPGVLDLGAYELTFDPDAPPAIVLLPLIDGLTESDAPQPRTKVADILVIGSFSGTVAVGLSGADADAFEIDGTELFLRQGTVLDFGTQPALDVVVFVDDPAISGAPDDSAGYTLDVREVINLAPQDIILTPAVAAIEENTDLASALKIADIRVIDDSVGMNRIALSGADADAFEIDGTELFLKPGTVLDFETQPALTVSVTVDDPQVGAAPDASRALTLTILDAPEVIAPTDQGDNILGTAAAEIIDAGAGNDTIVALAGDDTLFGGTGDDILDGGAGGDRLIGGDGGDTIWVDDSTDRAFESRRWQGTDAVVSAVDFALGRQHIENLTLTGTAITGTGNGLRNTLTGTDGDNILDGGRNIDTLFGGAGDDTYVLRHAQDQAIEPETDSRYQDARGDSGHDTVLAHNSFRLARGIEDIILQDVIGQGGAAVAGLTAIGNALDNHLQGNATANNLNGRTGNDTLTGGGGADDFIFSDTLGPNNRDSITDFVTGEDRIVIKGALVDIASGQLAAAAFHSGAEALTADHRLIFEGGILRYDADGAGAGLAVDIAQFAPGTLLTAGDILIT